MNSIAVGIYKSGVSQKRAFSFAWYSWIFASYEGFISHCVLVISFLMEKRKHMFVAFYFFHFSLRFFTDFVSDVENMEIEKNK